MRLKVEHVNPSNAGTLWEDSVKVRKHQRRENIYVTARAIPLASCSSLSSSRNSSPTAEVDHHRYQSASRIQAAEHISTRQDWPHSSAMDSKDVGRDNKSPESDLGDEAVVEPLTKAQRKRLVLKTDLVIMPLAIVCMTIAFLDKVSHIYNTSCMPY